MVLAISLSASVQEDLFGEFSLGLYHISKNAEDYCLETYDSQDSCKDSGGKKRGNHTRIQEMDQDAQAQEPTSKHYD